MDQAPAYGATHHNVETRDISANYVYDSVIRHVHTHTGMGRGLVLCSPVHRIDMLSAPS